MSLNSGMNRKKPYNQILFVTTLSLYLGLVLVCAAPEVLAQTEQSAKVVVAFQERGEKPEVVSTKGKVGEFVGSLTSLIDISKVSFISVSISPISEISFSFRGSLNAVAVNSLELLISSRDLFFSQVSTLPRMARASL